MSAAFRGSGIDAQAVPDSDEETLELGALHSNGEECLPHRITLGDFLKICRQPGFDAARTAFLMPSAPGPCRFGQYAPYLERVLEEQGYGDVFVFSPTSGDGYDGFGSRSSDLMKTVWIGLVAGDLATKFLLKTRPYEDVAGDSDEVFVRAVERFENVLSTPGPGPKEKLQALIVALERMRDRFRSVPAHYTRERPLIGLVGEIFCRLNTFSNEDVARRVERAGGECWLSDITEWIWYTNWSRETEALVGRARFGLRYLELRLKSLTQRRYEHALLAPVADDVRGYEEPHDIREVLAAAQPYLPAEGALGEMVLAVGKAIHFHEKGADGVLDISPFTCMNGIVSEAVYPALSADREDIPIRSCYFDKTTTRLDDDLEIFLDLARAYQGRKSRVRTYPAYFPNGA
jgi:predicted nucleotide-binding protein (sugar kinase/HSP70/actin superfamily)